MVTAIQKLGYGQCLWVVPSRSYTVYLWGGANSLLGYQNLGRVLVWVYPYCFCSAQSWCWGNKPCPSIAAPFVPTLGTELMMPLWGVPLALCSRSGFQAFLAPHPPRATSLLSLMSMGAAYFLGSWTKHSAAEVERPLAPTSIPSWCFHNTKHSKDWKAHSATALVGTTRVSKKI